MRMMTKLLVALVLIILGSASIQPVNAASAFAVPTGKFVFATSSDEGAGELYTMGTDGSHVTQITPAGDDGKMACMPVWSPDGKAIAYISGAPDAFCKGRVMLIVGQDDQSNIIPMSEDDQVMEAPVWSPSGDRLALVDGTRIVIINTPDLGRLYSTLSDPMLMIKLPLGGYGLAWSPDGKQLAYTYQPGMQHHIVVMEIRDFYIQKISFSESAGAPKWSPDGKWLAYAPSDISGPHVDSSDGKRSIPLTLNPLLMQPPEVAWSPDGKQLATGDDELYLVNLNGKPPIKLSDNNLTPRNVVWLSANVIAVINYEDKAIYLVNISNGQQMKVTEGLEVSSFSWVKG